MWNCELSSKWVNNILDQLAKDPLLFYGRDMSLFDAWVTMVQAKIVKKEAFNGSVFLLACIGYFVFYDLKDQKVCLSSNLTQRQPNIRYRRPLHALDVLEIQTRFNSLLTELTKNLSKHCDLEEYKVAFYWFELLEGLHRQAKIDRYIQRYRTVHVESTGEKPKIRAGQQEEIGSIALIPSEFIQYIFYDHYGLDPQIAKDGLPKVNRCTAEETAQKLNVTKLNLIKKCLDDNIGVYVNVGQYKARKTSGSIHKELIDATKDDTYHYPHRGLLRLSRCTMQILYESPIQANGQPYRNIQLQPSLTELIQGYAWCIELRGTQQITIDDLVFIDDEILDHLSGTQLILNKATEHGKLLLSTRGSVEDDSQDFSEQGNSDSQQSALTFKKDKTTYSFSFNGKSVPIPISVGLKRFAYLVNHSDKEISALDLSQHFNSDQGTQGITHIPQSYDALAQQDITSDPFYSNDEVLDKEAIKQYKEGIEQLKKEIENANDRGDTEKADRLTLEKEQIEDELIKNTHKHGKSRKNKNPNDQARSAVSHSIRNAINQFQETFPELYAHLNEKKGRIKRVQLGSTCIYRSSL